MTTGVGHGACSAVESLLRLLDADAVPSGDALPPEQWEAVERVALRHGLAPLLHRQLSMGAGLPAPPAALMQRLQDVRVHSTMRSAVVRAGLGEVLRALRSEQIDVIVLKGAFLAEDVYDEAGLRPMADVDLLVRRERLERTRSLLESLGYSSVPGAQVQDHHHLPQFSKSGMIPIEVHWAPSRFGAGTNVDVATWSTARPAQVAGVEVLALAPEALLHHLCVHLAHGHRFWVPLLHLHDLAAVVGRYPIDWERLETVAREQGSCRFVYAALALARRAYPSGFAPSALAQMARLAHDADDERVVEMVWEELLMPAHDFPRLLARVDAAPDSRARARLLWQHLFPSPARMSLAAASRRHALPWAYLWRLADVLRRRWHTPLSLLLRTAGGRDVRQQASRRAVVERWARAGEVP